MTSVNQLGYVGLNVSDPGVWQQYGEQVLGLRRTRSRKGEIVARLLADAVRDRDDRDHEHEPGDEDRVAVANAEAPERVKEAGHAANQFAISGALP